MPAYSRGTARDQLRFVRLNPIFLYGWKTVDLAARTGIAAADLNAQLGHLNPAEAAAVPNRIMVTGANSPKPGRVTRRDLTAPITQPASTSSFIAYDKLADAAAAGWTLAKAANSVRLTANVDGQRSCTAIAELSNNLLYAYSLNRADFERVNAVLGLSAAAVITTAAERNRLCTGSRTKPAKVSIVDDNGVFSTFCSTAAIDAALTAGYTLEEGEFIEFGAAAAPDPNP